MGSSHRAGVVWEGERKRPLVWSPWPGAIVILWSQHSVSKENNQGFLKYSILFITQNNQGTKIFKKKQKKTCTKIFYLLNKV